MATTCLQTTVKNISGGRMHFGFLPLYGRTLNNNETFTWNGGLMDGILQRTRGHMDQRLISCMMNALNRDHTLQIVRTPSPVLLDATTGAPRIVILNNGTLDDAAPCYA